MHRHQRTYSNCVRMKPIVIAGQQVRAAWTANVPAIAVDVGPFAAKLSKPHGARAMHRDVISKKLATICATVARAIP